MTEPKYPFELFARECMSGWDALIDKLIKDLLDTGWKGDILQIKEKFGGLRFYASETNDKQGELIFKAEEESFNICEVCGKPGKLRGDRWLATRCEEHDGI